MSNNELPRENADQAEDLNRNLSYAREGAIVDFSKMSDEEVIKIADSLINTLETEENYGGQQGVELLLEREKAGFSPNEKVRKSILKTRFPHIEFKTPKWQEWWRNVEPMTQEEVDNIYNPIE